MNKALKEYVKNNNIQLVKELLNKNKHFFLITLHLQVMYATENGYAECLRLLLEAGADPNFMLVGANSPLMIASIYNQIECLRIILKAGACISKTTQGNHTALSLKEYDVHSKKCIKIIKILKRMIIVQFLNNYSSV